LTLVFVDAFARLMFDI